MRRTTVHRTAVAASALSLALLTGACGSGETKTDDAKGGKGDAAATKAVSQTDLDKLVLAESDLKDHKIVNASKADIAAAKVVTTDKAECKPLVDAMALRPLGRPAATSMRKVMAVPPKPAKDASPEEKMKAGLGALGGTITSDTLGSYDGKGATEALAGLRAAGEACADGFSVIVGKDKTKYTKVAPATYTAGDEAVAFTLTADLEGMTGTAHLVAVQKGGTLASFYAQSLTGKAEQPKAVIDAQVAKLG
ncbi:hypothetical protein BGM19_33110 [Streptomyces agglomeratus]|uniref:hypothetical protein n=1 Tax=Streptomyces agglomeratus TaxID=285458 RepID=UPI000868700F|nr:hypothetical protein [Streptomyces agglomeratus]OEJ62152.1 hypothetical protein BGM19_33110 [Streptomyces agglomeratus]